VSTNKTLALVGLGAVGVFLLSRVAQARALVPAGPTLLPAEQSTLDKLLGGTKTALGIAGAASGALAGLGIGGGGAAAAAVPVSTIAVGGAIATTAALPAATVGIDAATLAALPGATAIPAAPAIVAGEISAQSSAGATAAVTAGSVALQLATAGLLVGGLAGLGYVLGWWGDSGIDYAPGCDPSQPGYDPAMCGNAADSGTSHSVTNAEGQTIFVGGNVNIATYEDAVAVGFGEGQY
jgi:hypothetical protein